eukprot:m.218081 g.218081  ORF g.218081 m.218081 type:complete len:1276 (+) comp17213_c0_seq2:178-4005(+)
MSLRLRGRAKRKEAVPATVIGTDVRRVGGLNAETYKTILAAEQAALAQRVKVKEVGGDSARGKRKDKRRGKIQVQQGSFRKVGGISLHQETDDNTVTTVTLDRSIGETAGIEFQSGDGFEKLTGTYIHHVDMGSAAEALGLHLGDEVLVINDVDVGNRPVEEVLSIVQAVNLVVLQIRKASLPDIVAWQAGASSGAQSVGSVNDAMQSQAQVHRKQHSKHEALTLPLPDSPPANDSANKVTTEPERTITSPLNGHHRLAETQPQTPPNRNMNGSAPQTSSPRNANDIDPTTVANTIVNGISPMRSALRKTPKNRTSSTSSKSKGARGRSVHFDLPSTVPERTTSGQHPLAVRRGRPTPAPVPIPDRTLQATAGQTPRRQPIQPLPLLPDPVEPELARPHAASNPHPASNRRDARLDTLNQEADAMSERLEGLLRASRRQSDPLTTQGERASPNASRSLSAGTLGTQGYSSPGVSPLLPVFGSDPSQEAGLAGDRLSHEPYNSRVQALGREEQPWSARARHETGTGAELADEPEQDVVDWNASATLDKAVYLDRDGDQSPTFGPVFQVQLVRGLGGLGMRIAGGCDTRLGALFVAFVEPGGAADRSGKIAVGDRFLNVANTDVRGMTQDNLRRCIAAHLAASTAPVPFELMRIGQAQWHQLQRVAGIKLAIDQHDATQTAPLSPLRKSQGQVWDPEAYTLEPTYLSTPSSPQRLSYQSAKMATPAARPYQTSSTGSLPGSLREAASLAPVRSFSNDTLSRELGYEPGYSLDAKHVYQPDEQPSYGFSAPDQLDVGSGPITHVHDPELYTLEAEYLPAEKVSTVPLSDLDGSSSHAPLLSRSRPDAMAATHDDPRTIAARALHLANQVQSRVQAQHIPEPSASPVPLTSSWSSRSTSLGSFSEPPSSFDTVDEAPEPSSRGLSPSRPGRAAHLVVQPRLGSLPEQDSPPSQSTDASVRLATITAPVVRPELDGSGSADKGNGSSDHVNDLDYRDDKDGGEDGSDDNTRNNAHDSPVDESHPGHISRLVLADVDGSSSSEEMDMDEIDDEVDVDAIVSQPEQEEPVMDTPATSQPAERMSLHAIAPRRRSSISMATNPSADPAWDQLVTDATSTASPMAAALQGAQETLQRRASASQDLLLDTSHSSRRASIRNWLREQQDELKEQQTVQAQAEADNHRRRQQQLAQQHQQQAQERFRIAQEAEQSRRHAELDLEEQAAHEEISAALQRRGSISQTGGNRRASISSRTLEMRQQFLQSSTGRASPTSPSPRVLPLPPQ